MKLTGRYILIFVLSQFFIISTMALDKEDYMMKTLDNIDKKTSSIDSNLLEIRERLVRVETWQEEKMKNITRFYSTDFKALQVKNNDQDHEISKIKHSIAKSKGFFISLVFFGGVLSSCLTLMAQYWVIMKNKKTNLRGSI